MYSRSRRALAAAAASAFACLLPVAGCTLETGEDAARALAGKSQTSDIETGNFRVIQRDLA